MIFEEILTLPLYSLSQAEKEAVLLEQLNVLTDHHRSHCTAYDRIVRTIQSDFTHADRLSAMPFLPVGLFKTHQLMSIPEDKIFKTMTSRGTTSQRVSQIFLDSETAARQSAALARIMTHILGRQRLPMLIIDTPSVLRNRQTFSARGAGILGTMMFGRKPTYALNDEMCLELSQVQEFLERFSNEHILIFGFTFMVWEYFLKPLRGRGIDLSQATLIHSGGWKKLQEQAVTNQEFKRVLQAETGIKQIYNFYGMIEQVGSVFVEGEDGYLYPPNFADVIIRDPVTWQEAPIGRPGVIEVLSILPLSYPGHAILTEDLGVIHGIDDAPCGRQGKYFSVIGRVPRAELRGCSDTHAYDQPTTL